MTVTTDAPRGVNTDPHLASTAEYMIHATSADMPGYNPSVWADSYHDAIRANVGPMMEFLLSHGTFDLADGQVGVRMCEILGGSGFGGARRSPDGGFERALGVWARVIVERYMNEKYPVGSRWTFVGPDNHASSIPDGRTVERIDRPIRVGFIGYSPCVYVGEIGNDDRPQGDLHVGPENLRPLHSTVENLNADVVSRAEHDRVLRDLAARDARIAQWEQDASEARRIFLSAANDHDLCGVFDDTVSEVNAVTTWLKFEPRVEEQEFNATRRVRVTTWVTQHGSYTGTNDEPDEDDFSWTDLDTSDVLNAVRNDWDVDFDDTEDFEYE